MAIKVTPAATAAQKYTQRAGGAGAEYAQNAAASASDWESMSVASAGNFKAAVSAGDIDKRWSGGIRKAGAGKYQRKVQSVGASRYSQGVSAGAQDYQSGVQPYLSAIEGITLPPRRPRGDPANQARVAPIGAALSALRLRLKASGG